MRAPAFLLATGAVAWGAAFAGFALLSGLAHPGATQEVALSALPLLVAALAWWLLHRTCATGASPGPARAITVVYLAFSAISSPSIGLLLAPAGLLLAAALATVRPGGREI